MEQITLKRLAELSGLSIRTVSRVLKDQAHVHPEKRELILALAREHNYIPNMAARNLRLNRSNFVGILSTGLSHESFMQKLLDLEVRLESCGYYPVVGQFTGKAEELETILTQWSGIAEFVVVTMFVGARVQPSVQELFRRFPLTPIYVDQDTLVEDGHTLNINRATGIRDAISTLIDEGKKKILRCGDLPSREKGLQEAFEKTPPARRPELIRLNALGSFENGRNLGKKILESGADAVFFDTDRMALGFLNYATEHGVKVPDRIAVIGFDDEVGGKLVYPSLSTVAHPVEALNKAILSIIQEKPEKPVHQVFPTRFIRRMSS